MSTDSIIRRLTLIKYLFNQGVEQSIKPEPIRGFSILHFHDAAEMFLQFASEYNDTKKKGNGFRDYWNALPQLTHKEPMSALNARRNSLKHQGHLPGKDDIIICKSTCEEFLVSNTKSVFGIDFAEISLANLLSFEKTKDYLKRAEKHLNNNEYMRSIEQSKYAFDELLVEYKSNKRAFGIDAFDISMGPVHRAIGMTSLTDQAVMDLKSVVKILALGIDFKKYTKFEFLTQKLDGRHLTIQGKILTESKDKLFNEANAQFCLNFTIESGLVLQDFDFELDELMKG